MRKLKKSELKRVYGGAHDKGNQKSTVNDPFDNPGSASDRGDSVDSTGNTDPTNP